MLTMLQHCGLGSLPDDELLPLPAADLTDVDPVRGPERFWLVFEPRWVGVVLVVLWGLGLTCSILIGVLPREAALVLGGVAIAGYGGAGSILFAAVRQRSTPPVFDMLVCHSLYRLGLRRPFAYARARLDAVRAYESVAEDLRAMIYFRDVAGDVRQIASTLTGRRVHALAMLAFMLEEPRTAEGIPSLIAERGTTDPLQVYSLLTAAAPGTGGTLGAGAL